ncbi:hypothetical protein KSS87_015783 [Heliosperma pusillum]|nr:hypothetical protein KSS87_015783 [Heliosperma pusillum]
MAKIESTQQPQPQQQQSMDNVPPAGYPTLGSPEGKMKKKKGGFRSKQKGEKGFIEGWPGTAAVVVLRLVGQARGVEGPWS